MDLLNSITWVDYVALIVMLLSIAFGLMRGYVKELIALSSWAVAFLLARYASPMVVPWLAHIISNEMGQWVTAYISLFVLGLILMTLLGYGLSSLVESVGLGESSAGRAIWRIARLFNPLGPGNVGRLNAHPHANRLEKSLFHPRLNVGIPTHYPLFAQRYTPAHLFLDTVLLRTG